jgi:hypothetical protein
MVDRREDPGFLFEQAQARMVGGTFDMQRLYRHRPAESDVAGSVDYSHPASANRLTDLIGTKSSAVWDRHSSLSLTSADLDARESRYDSQGFPQSTGSTCSEVTD